MKAMNMIKLCVVLLAATLLLSTDAFAATKSVKVMTNLTCGDCKAKIETGLKGVEGIEKTDVDVASKIVTVSYDADAISESSITKKISGLGYTTEVVTADTKVETSGHGKGCCSKKKGAGSKKSCGTKNYDKKSCDTKSHDKKSCGSKEKGAKKS